MNKREHDGTNGDAKIVALGAGADDEPLAYVVELWTLARDGPERVLGRAASASVAQAIFTAAQSEHLGRRIVMRRGGRVVSEAG